MSKWSIKKKIDKAESYIEVDSDITDIVTKILSTHPNLVDNARGRSLADPYVIAAAILHNKNHPDKNFTVVTLEKRTGNPKKPKIPDVCASEQVDCIDLFEFIKKKKPVFTIEKK